MRGARHAIAAELVGIAAMAEFLMSPSEHTMRR